MNLCDCGYTSSKYRDRCVKCGKPFTSPNTASYPKPAPEDDPECIMITGGRVAKKTVDRIRQYMEDRSKYGGPDEEQTVIILEVPLGTTIKTLKASEIVTELEIKEKTDGEE